MIYLDGHSTTPLDPLVFEAMKPYFLERFGNASHGLHIFNWEAESGLNRARDQVARALGANEKEIVFTSGATEANHLAILGGAPALMSAGKKRILSIEIEHASVLGALELMRGKGFAIDWVKVARDGRVDLGDLRDKLASDVGLVSIALANHEVGTIQDLATISELSRASGAWLHTDAVQAFGKIPFTVDSIGADLLTLSAHKIHGPKGAGALYVRRKNPRVSLAPIQLGGGQERGLRPGTPNTPAWVGFGVACELSGSLMISESKRVAELRDFLWSVLERALPCIKRNGSEEHALPNNLNVSIEGVDGAALFGRLKGFAVSNASACLNGTQDYSQVLTVLGVERDLARATLRFGLGRFTTREEIEKASEELIFVVNELRRMEKEFAAQTGTVYRSGGCTS
ncbi:MAG: cysteine desulfurase [Bdellovibrionales bacterium]|nr:cysteine desulfurase [Bdellovibrionales bacterium]